METEDKRKKVIALFDVDGTLTKPRNKIEQRMIDSLKELQKKIYVGIVGGSDLTKIKEQIGANLVNDMDYAFSENGLLSLKKGNFLAETSFKNYMGDEKINKFVNFCLKYLSEIEIPIKRGTFIEFRTGMLNISPIGRNCSQQERDDFEKYDKEHKIREAFVNVLKEKFSDYNLTYSIGGQISFDVFPNGWDKTFCLQYITDFPEIHFFGDKTFKGGNDYEIYSSDKTIGHEVKTFDDTIELITKLF